MSIIPRPPPAALPHTAPLPLASRQRPAPTSVRGAHVGNLDDVLVASKSRATCKADDKGMEQLRSELQVAQLRLTMAEGHKIPLGALLENQKSRLEQQSYLKETSLLAHLDRLRADCARSETALADVRAELQDSRDGWQALAKRLAISEATAEHAGREWQEWQRRCKGVERGSAAMAMRVDTVTAELQTSERSERSLAASAVQQRLRGAEAENAEAEACVQARILLGDSQQLARSLAVGASEIEVLRAELHEAEARGLNAQRSLARVERENDILREDRDTQHKALEVAAERNGALASRCERFEAAPSSTERFGAVSQLLSSRVVAANLTTLNPACSSGFEAGSPRAAGPGSGLMGLTLPPATPQSARLASSQRSRWDYPKAAAARDLRAQIVVPRS